MNFGLSRCLGEQGYCPVLTSRIMAVLCGIIFLFWLVDECTASKKYCWYFEGGYPIYFICRSYEDCCGTRCCVRALSIQRLWYFWLLLMMGVLFCCGAGFFIRRRMNPSPLPEDTFNVSFTRHPMTASGESQSHSLVSCPLPPLHIILIHPLPLPFSLPSLYILFLSKYTSFIFLFNSPLPHPLSRSPSLYLPCSSSVLHHGPFLSLSGPMETELLERNAAYSYSCL
uniref:WW domain binding protein VOPP1 n=1 Tax=Hucho hucho TaxID=62062 RepID=A0A4W5LCL0_9TELE